MATRKGLKIIKADHPTLFNEESDPFAKKMSVGPSSPDMRLMQNTTGKTTERRTKRFNKAVMVLPAKSKLSAIMVPGTEFNQTILGNPPAKSNCYRIVKLKGKNSGESIALDNFYRGQLASCKTFSDVRMLLEDIDDLTVGGHYSLAKSAKLKKYEKDFALQAGPIRNLMIGNEFIFEMNVWFPSRRSDIDNSLKVVLDCLQPQTKGSPNKTNTIVNDSQCQRVIVNKFIDKENPRIEFKIIVL